MKYLRLLITGLALLLTGCGVTEVEQTSSEILTTSNNEGYYNTDDFTSVLAGAPEYSFDMPFTEDDHESVFGTYPIAIKAEVLGMKGVITSKDDAILSPKQLVSEYPEISKSLPSTKDKEGKKGVTPNYSDNSNTNEPVHFATIWEVRVTEILKDDDSELKIGDVIKISRVGLPSSIVNENETISGKSTMMMVLSPSTTENGEKYFGLGPYDESYIITSNNEKNDVYKDFKQYSGMNPDDLDVEEYDYQSKPPASGR
ncbi:hypothetical protein HCA78_17250 [Listeria booriae]|uniref:Lipoprotein n=1 Tax=Listeria booriae TaxID=1552123 RepID=A0A842CTE9_9LIST|nr:hypothetical protein [Listeria booriae]MBC2005518.1 hypothetical protein [Listeria booriae]